MIAYFDTECYRNFWLLRLRPRGGPTLSFRLYSGQRFDYATTTTIRNLFDSYTVVSFNGLGYDKWLIGYALEGATPEQLKVINDRIIVDQIKPWELGLPRWEPRDHIDLRETAPGDGSQKLYAGRIHCKRMQDLPYDPALDLTPEQMVTLEEYCGNDLDVLEALHDALQPELAQRVALGARYGIDLRSKSDAQIAETVLWRRCEQAVGRRIYKSDPDWNLHFKFRVPEFIGFNMPQLRRALELVRDAVFRLGGNGSVEMPSTLEGLEIVIGGSTYKMGIGGLHSQEKRLVAVTDDKRVILMPDVASYYPNLMLNSGEYPTALGEAFLSEFRSIMNERLQAKALAKKLPKGTPEQIEAATADAGGKIQINGTFGKTGSPYSILFAPTMLIQTTLTGQLSLLMLIEWHEHHGIPVVSANTDGIVVKCPREKRALSQWLIAEWEKRTNLTMETVEYRSIYARDVNNYFAIDATGDVKRKGEYAKGSLAGKKNPDVEICSDAVAAYLAHGKPLLITLLECRDIRKFVTIQRVTGGAIKMWGEGPLKTDKVRDMIPRIEAHGWSKEGRKWRNGAELADAQTAYASTFAPQRPEYLGKVVRWYYGTNSPGPIIYAARNATVSLSHGSTPCMTLPDEFPSDVDYAWYLRKCDSILRDVGYYTLS